MNYRGRFAGFARVQPVFAGGIAMASGGSVPSALRVRPAPASIAWTAYDPTVSAVPQGGAIPAEATQAWTARGPSLAVVVSPAKGDTTWTAWSPAEAISVSPSKGATTWASRGPTTNVQANPAGGAETWTARNPTVTTVPDDTFCAGAYLCDHFTDTNGTNLASHTMNVGSGWTSQGLSGWTISSNRTAQSTIVGGFMGATADAGHADGTCEVDMFTAASGNYAVYLIFRWLNVLNFWDMRMDSTTNLITIQETTSGVSTNRANVAFTLSNSQSFTAKVVLSGTSITCSIGATTVSFTSSAQQSNTLFGIAEYRDNTISYNANTFDNFRVYP